MAARVDVEILGRHHVRVLVPPPARCSLTARATAAPPATASDPPSQKSFCTSTMISARISPTVSWALMPRPAYWNHNLHYQPVILNAVPPGCQTALDVGCGDGLLAARLAERCAQVTGIDRDPPMIAAARARAPEPA